MTRRDLLVALIAASLTLGPVWPACGPEAGPLGSQVFDWTAMTVRPNATGEVRTVVRAPTVTLDELEMHITTLKPGEASHPPHQHPERGAADHPGRAPWRRWSPASTSASGPARSSSRPRISCTTSGTSAPRRPPITSSTGRRRPHPSDSRDAGGCGGDR